jgi:hypothetical protein
MAKGKRKPKVAAKEKPLDHSLADLVELAEATGFDPDILDEELEAAADDERDMILENVRSESLHRRLEFLYFHGYALGRLEEIIKKKNTDPFAD